MRLALKVILLGMGLSAVASAAGLYEAPDLEKLWKIRDGEKAKFSVKPLDLDAFLLELDNLEIGEVTAPKTQESGNVTFILEANQNLKFRRGEEILDGSATLLNIVNL